MISCDRWLGRPTVATHIWAHDGEASLDQRRCHPVPGGAGSRMTMDKQKGWTVTRIPAPKFHIANADTFVNESFKHFQQPPSHDLPLAARRVIVHPLRDSARHKGRHHSRVDFTGEVVPRLLLAANLGNPSWVRVARCSSPLPEASVRSMPFLGLRRDRNPLLPAPCALRMPLCNHRRFGTPAAGMSASRSRLSATDPSTSSS